MYWYGYERIEGADFYYYAKAMESVNPVSELLAKSKAFKLEYSAPKGTRISGLRQGDKGVLLVVCGANRNQAVRFQLHYPQTSLVLSAYCHRVKLWLKSILVKPRSLLLQQ